MLEDQFEDLEYRLKSLEQDNRDLQGQLSLMEMKLSERMNFHAKNITGSLVTSTVMGLAVYDGIFWVIRKFFS